MVAGTWAASFVARIWLESEPNGDPKWRGHVQHVQSDLSGFFDDLHTLKAFVERVSGIAGPALRLRQRPIGRPRSRARPERKGPAAGRGTRGRG